MANLGANRNYLRKVGYVVDVDGHGLPLGRRNRLRGRFAPRGPRRGGGPGGAAAAARLLEPGAAAGRGSRTGRGARGGTRAAAVPLGAAAGGTRLEVMLSVKLSQLKSSLDSSQIF